MAILFRSHATNRSVITRTSMCLHRRTAISARIVPRRRVRVNAVEPRPFTTSIVRFSQPVRRSATQRRNRPSCRSNAPPT